MVRHVVRSACLALPLLLAACPGETGETSEGTLVVGVQSDDLGTLLSSVHLVAKVDGATQADLTQTAAPVLPKEIEIRGNAGARVEVLVEGVSAATQNVLVTRRAETFMPGAKKLLRVQLDARCAAALPISGGGGTLDGAGPESCAAPNTCVGGRCVSPLVPIDALEEYAPNWPATAPDLCRPANAGPPELVLGTGQTDYGPLADGQTLQLEKGPQGGHHIWMAVRMRNMKRSGSRTALTAKLPSDPGAQIYPAAYVFSFDRDEGSFCKLYGLRFQLDSGASDLREAYKKFLGKELEVTVEVADTIGQRATATRKIKIADKILCPDGTTTSCQ